jgi:hypothetical protein
MKLQIRLLSRPREYNTTASSSSLSSGYAVYTSPVHGPIGCCGVLPSAVAAGVALRDATKISYCFPSAESIKTKQNNTFRPIVVEFADFEEVSSMLFARELWSSPSFQANEKIGFLLM